MSVTIDHKPVILDVDDEVRKWMDAYQPLDQMNAFGLTGGASFGKQGGDYLERDFDTGMTDKLPPLRINELYWPTGASRFAVGFFLMRYEDVLEICPMPMRSTVTLRVNAIKSLTAEMYMGWRLVSPKQHDDTDTENRLCLVMLVDERFWWQGKNAGAFEVGNAPTWADIFAELGPRLVGGTLGYTTFASWMMYFPSVKHIVRPYENLPRLMDAICESTGLRVVRQLDGSVFCQSFYAARAVVDDNLESLDGHLIAGGELPQVGLPAEVDVVFPRVVNNVEIDGPHIITVSPTAGAGHDDQAVAGTRGTIYSTAMATWDNGDVDSADPDNSVKLNEMAEAVSRLFFYQYDRSYDVTIQGVADWEISALDDYLIYRFGVPCHGEIACTTRVQSKPYDGSPSYSLLQTNSDSTGMRLLRGQTHIAYLPSGDLPARSGTTVYGYAAHIQKIDINSVGNGYPHEGTLANSGITVVVFNPFDYDVPGSSYVTVVVDDQGIPWITNCENWDYFPPE